MTEWGANKFHSKLSFTILFSKGNLESASLWIISDKRRTHSTTFLTDSPYVDMSRKRSLRFQIGRASLDPLLAQGTRTRLLAP